MHTRAQSVTQHIHLLRPIGAAAVVAAQAPLPTYSIPAPSLFLCIIIVIITGAKINL